jgi:hypothetical protein
LVTTTPEKSSKRPSRTSLTVVSAGLLTLASATIIVLFARWVRSYDRVYFPAVEASRVAVFTAGFLGEGWFLAAGIALTAAAAVLLWLRLLPHLTSMPVMVWFALSIGMALPVGIYASPAIALPFIASALAAVCVVLIRHRPVVTTED